MDNILKMSIIVPCYNQAQYLDECLESVLNQTYQEWECIVVNDGSSDNTDEIALQWTKKNTRFKYIKKENGGLSSARNSGIKNAVGKYILPLDADDKISFDYVSEAMKIINENPKTTLVYCKAWLFGTEEGFWNLPEYNYCNLLFNNNIFCSAVYKKEDWIKAGGYDENMKAGLEDWDFWLRILNKDSIVVKLPLIGFFYRKKQVSMINNIINDKQKYRNITNYIFNKQINIVEDYFDLPLSHILKDYIEFKDKYSIQEMKIHDLMSNYKIIGTEIKISNLLKAILFKVKKKIFHLKKYQNKK